MFDADCQVLLPYGTNDITIVEYFILWDHDVAISVGVNPIAGPLHPESEFIAKIYYCAPCRYRIEAGITMFAVTGVPFASTVYSCNGFDIFVDCRLLPCICMHTLVYTEI